MYIVISLGLPNSKEVFKKNTNLIKHPLIIFSDAGALNDREALFFKAGRLALGVAQNTTQKNFLPVGEAGYRDL